MFKGVDNLKYINVYNVQDPNKVLLNYKLPTKLLSNEPIVCQKEDYKIISHNNIITKCCNYEINTGECGSTNFITLYYSEDVEYNSDEYDFSSSIINYIINSNNNNGKTRRLSIKTGRNLESELYTRPLIIKKGEKLDIYFSSPLESLENSFSASKDPNMKPV